MASQASLSLAQSLYVAYYGRPADPEGLEFWATVLDDKTVDIKVMLTDFGNSPEYTSRFGNLTSEQLVNNLYLQMFGRSAEPEGRDFWVGVLARGERNLAEIADSIRSLASPKDKEVLDARTKLADAFTEQLDTNEELQAYGTDRGLNIGRDYLNQVTQANASNPPIDQVVDVVATLLPTDNGGGTGGGGGGGVTPPPAKTLVLGTADGELTFTGTATGAITVTESAGVLTFARDGVTATQNKTTFDGLTDINVGNAALSIAGELLSGQEVSGTGTVTITGVVALAALENAAVGGAPLVYTTVSGSSDDLSDNTAGLLKAGVNVIVTGPSVTIADLAGLSALAAVVAPGTITASDIEDTIEHMVSGSPAVASQYINAGANVALTNPATVEQIAAVDAANGDGTLTYSIRDSVVALLAADPDLVDGAVEVTLTGGLDLGAVTVEQLNTVLGWANLNGDGVTYNELTYSLVDSAANLLSLGNDELQRADAVTATGQSSLTDASALYKLYTNAVYSITDSASSLANPSNADREAAVDHAVDLTASNPATVAQAVAILAHSNTGDTVYNLRDSVSNILAAGAAGNGAHDITVNNFNFITVSNAQTIVNFTNDGVTTLGAIQDTAANINTFVGANAWASNSLTYSFSVRDSAANIVAALGNLDFVEGNSSEPGDHSVTQIYVTDSFSTATAKQFWEAVNPSFLSVDSTTAAKTNYSIVDSIANYISDEQPGGVNTPSAITDWVRDADRKVVTGNAADINTAQDQGRLIFAELDGNDSIQTTGSAGNQILYGSAGSDILDGGDGDDTIYGGGGWDTIYGGTGYNYLHGGDGRDTIFAGAVAANTDSARLNDNSYNLVVGGNGSDLMYGSTNKDIFIYEARNGADLILETGNTAATRDYIYNLSQGDRITFADNAKLQFLGNGSTNASSVNAGDFGLSIRYDKVTNAELWNGTTGAATRVSIDIAKADGTFDNLADAMIVLVGTDIDIRVEGNSIFYGA